MCFFFFKQKTAYEMRISDWSSDVCSSDLLPAQRGLGARPGQGEVALEPAGRLDDVLREQFQPGQPVGGEVDFAAERGAGIPARGQTRVDAAVAVERAGERGPDGLARKSVV